MNFMPVRAVEQAAQRAVGCLALAFAHDGAQTRIEKLYQQGCLKTRLPRPQNPETLEAVTMNIGGGIAGGDSLATEFLLRPGAHVSISSQAAERVYRALNAPSRIVTRIGLGAGASLAHLPQETILFNGFALDRSLEIDLAPTATYLGVESLIFGRQAMGETIRAGTLNDKILLRRGRRVILQDMTRLNGDIAAQLARKAVAGGAMAVASLIYAAPDTAEKLPAIRAALAGHHAGAAQAGASAFEGIIFARLLAPSAISLRKCLVAALHACGAVLPKVWQG
jgi:urease accessory protein